MLWQVAPIEMSCLGAVLVVLEWSQLIWGGPNRSGVVWGVWVVHGGSGVMGDGLENLCT